jgi:GT2 family glycosyltransferase
MAPAVSIVVATHQRRQRLERLVRALEAQAGSPEFEVLIVDDASTDGTPQELARLARDSAVPLRPLRLERNAGPATARNLGWRTATAPLIAFTDDDCLPQPGWLGALVRGFDDADMVQGRTLPNPSEARRRGPFSHTLRIDGEGGFYETCNMAYRTELLERLDGFDEEFRFPYGEDLDLAWRAKTAGARSTFRRDAVVYHDVSTSSFLAHVRRTRRVEGVVLVASKHPALRSHLGVRVFSQRSHPPALVAGAGLALLATARGSRLRAPAGAALLTPYGWYRVRSKPLHGSPRARLGAIPLALVADLIEITELARASARLRTLVL